MNSAHLSNPDFFNSSVIKDILVKSFFNIENNLNLNKSSASSSDIAIKTRKMLSFE